MPRFWMAARVFACATPSGVVLLDLKRDRYVGVGLSESVALANEVGDWPLTTVRTERVEAFPDTCMALLEQGLLTREAPVQHRRAMPDLRAELVSVGDEIEADSRVGVRDIMNFAAALAFAAWSLNCRPLIKVVDTILREKGGSATPTGLSGDLGQLALLVDKFRKMRALTFPAEGHCLLHAVSLVRFLSRYGWYPDWVMGVATHPWGAHAWVQWGRYLLDTNPEKVCRFMPIMVV